MKPGLALGLILLLAAGGMALRVVELDRRPMHTDEAVHAVKFLGLWERGTYHYNPDEYHGPSLYYLTLPFAWLSEARSAASLSETTLRLVPAVLGGILILLVLAVRPAMGHAAAVWAAVFTAGSPAMVFYSRYFIHEMPLVVFTFLFLAASWHYLQSRKAGWAIVAGVALGLMYATKETFVLVLAASAGAALLTLLYGRVRDGHRTVPAVRVTDAFACLLVAAVIGVAFFSSFGSNPAGPADSFNTYLPWFKRAEGASPHVHPWHYYLGLMGWTRNGGVTWTEGAILVLGLAAMGVGLVRRELPWGSIGWTRFLTFYTLLLSAGYSVLPYKTPWCELGFLHGWILLAGTGAAAAVWWLKSIYSRGLVMACLLAAAAHLGWQAWRAAVPLCDSQKNPFVYAHTLASTVELVEKVQSLASASPAGGSLVIRVMAKGGDYWPLPWYLRAYPNVGWHASVPDKPADAQAAVIIATPSFEPEIRKVLGDREVALGYFGLRPSVFLQLHVERGLWDRYLARQGSAEKRP